MYRARPAGELIHHDLGAMAAIYHRRAGITHLLAPPAPEILAVLEGLGAATAADLTAALADRFDLTADGDDVATVVGERLAELAGLGLVTVTRT